MVMMALTTEVMYLSPGHCRSIKEPVSEAFLQGRANGKISSLGKFCIFQFFKDTFSFFRPTTCQYLRRGSAKKQLEVKIICFNNSGSSVKSCHSMTFSRVDLNFLATSLLICSPKTTSVLSYPGQSWGLDISFLCCLPMILSVFLLHLVAAHCLLLSLLLDLSIPTLLQIIAQVLS